ncbi:MAG: hypothetical protein MK207_05100 [Saprospiraceae bacterium]|nr:hypothetical protein [Saprospiraceae bacterium]
MKQILVLLLALCIFWQLKCTKPAGCVDSKAINYDPSLTVANSSCIYPELILRINLIMGTLPFEINRIYNLGGYNTAFKVFQCYLSQIQFLSKNQIILSLDDYYPLLKEGNIDFNLGQVNVDHYENINFNIGIDPITNSNILNYLYDANHDLSLQSPDTMHWNSTDGYIFLKMVGKVDRNGDGIPNENESFDFQIGTNQLLRSIDLIINKHVNAESDTIELEFDIEKLFVNVDLQTEHGTKTIDNLPLASKIADNLMNAFTLKP